MPSTILFLSHKVGRHSLGIRNVNSTNMFVVAGDIIGLVDFDINALTLVLKFHLYRRSISFDIIKNCYRTVLIPYRTWNTTSFIVVRIHSSIFIVFDIIFVKSYPRRFVVTGSVSFTLNRFRISIYERYESAPVIKIHMSCRHNYLST